MVLDSEKLLEQAISQALIDGMKERLRYGGPLDAILKEAIEKHSASTRTLLEDAIASCIKDQAFRDEIRAAVRTSLAKNLIQKFGGEIERQVNALKSDPTTRARIVIAIEEICATKA